MRRRKCVHLPPILPHFLLILPIWLTFVACIASAADLASFRISQAVSRPPDIITYLEILDTEGKPIQNVQTSQLTPALVGTEQAAVTDVKPFSDSGEGVAYVLLVDISRSLKDAQFVQMREALNAWIDAMTDHDRAAVITFGTEVKLVHDFSADKDSLKAAVNAIKPTDAYTQLNRGLIEAMELLRRRTDPGLPLRRAIITLSDGHDDFAGGVTRQEVLDAMKVDRVPVYAIGFYNPPETQQKEDYLKVLGEFARTSGGAYFKVGSTPFPVMFSRMRQRLRDVLVARLSCEHCRADSQVYRLQMHLAADTRSLTDGIDIRMLANVSQPPPPTGLDQNPQPEPQPPPEPVQPPQPPRQPPPKPAPEPWWEALLMQIPWWGIGVGSMVLFAIAGMLSIRARARRQAEIKARAETGGIIDSDAAVPDHGLRQTDGPEISPASEKGDLDQAGEWPVKGEEKGGKRKGLGIRITVLRSHVGRRPYELTLMDRIVIGRGKKECDVSLPNDDEVSRQHCELLLKDHMVMVRDLSSINGTFVNGVPIGGHHRLQTDDILLLGKTELRVSFTEPE